MATIVPTKYSKRRKEEDDDDEEGGGKEGEGDDGGKGFKGFLMENEKFKIAKPRNWITQGMGDEHIDSVCLSVILFAFFR
jgi:hypothetical protein